MQIDFSESLEKALQVLRNGGVILYPTDTIWGLGCDATNEEAVEKIIRIKQRPAQKALSCWWLQKMILLNIQQALTRS